MKNPSTGENASFLTEEALVSLLNASDTRAFKEIFTRYSVKLFQIASGVLGDDDLAKDIVQEVFIDLWNRRNTSNIQTLSHYLTRAVKFRVLNHLRNGKVKEHHLKLMESIRFVNQTEESLNFKELEYSLKKALQNLPPRCKEIFELSRFDNLSHKEISAKLGISTKTVEVQIHKALAHLKVCLDKSLIIIVIMFLL